MPTELALLDTNVLVNSVYEGSEHFAPSRALLQGAKAHDAGFALLPQNLSEFCSAVTNPRRVTAPKTPAEALLAIRKFLDLPGVLLLPVPPDVGSRFLTLLERRPLSGPKVHDLMLIAGMLGNGVRRIYTFNADDFTPFAELEVIVPTKAPAEGPPSG
jgi:predicted nucleic acid-binding protein